MIPQYEIMDFDELREAYKENVEKWEQKEKDYERDMDSILAEKEEREDELNIAHKRLIRENIDCELTIDQVDLIFDHIRDIVWETDIDEFIKTTEFTIAFLNTLLGDFSPKKDGAL